MEAKKFGRGCEMSCEGAVVARISGKRRKMSRKGNLAKNRFEGLRDGIVEIQLCRSLLQVVRV